MPKTNEILLKIEGFKYATSLDLYLRCYHMHLSENSGNLCTNILPWGNTVTNIYPWELETHQELPNRKKWLFPWV